MKRKISLGSWFTPAFRLLRAMRWLRGTKWDPFGRARVRKVERRLIDDYERVIRACAERLDEETFAAIVAIAELPDVVRGYEDVKLRSVETYEARLAELSASIGVDIRPATIFED